MTCRCRSRCRCGCRCRSFFLLLQTRHYGSKVFNIRLQSRHFSGKIHNRVKQWLSIRQVNKGSSLKLRQNQPRQSTDLDEVIQREPAKDSKIQKKLKNSETLNCFQHLGLPSENNPSKSFKEIEHDVHDPVTQPLQSKIDVANHFGGGGHRQQHRIYQQNNRHRLT